MLAKFVDLSNKKNKTNAIKNERGGIMGGHFLLNHNHQIWKWLFPVMMVAVGMIICWVGGYE